MLIIMGPKCINTASDIVLSVSDRPGCMSIIDHPAHRTVTYLEYYTNCCNNTIRSPDDKHSIARNM